MEQVLTGKKKYTDKDYELREYECGYPGCDLTFKEYVRKVVTGGGQANRGHKGNGSTQVRCPGCKNFISTWDEGRTIKTEKGSRM